MINYTVGDGGDYPTWSAAMSDLPASFSDSRTYTQISDTSETENAFSSGNINLGGFSLIITSNNKPTGALNSGWVSTWTFPTGLAATAYSCFGKLADFLSNGDVVFDGINMTCNSAVLFLCIGGLITARLHVRNTILNSNNKTTPSGTQYGIITRSTTVIYNSKIVDFVRAIFLNTSNMCTVEYSTIYSTRTDENNDIGVLQNTTNTKITILNSIINQLSGSITALIKNSIIIKDIGSRVKIDPLSTNYEIKTRAYANSQFISSDYTDDSYLKPIGSTGSISIPQNIFYTKVNKNVLFTVTPSYVIGSYYTGYGIAPSVAGNTDIGLLTRPSVAGYTIGCHETVVSKSISGYYWNFGDGKTSNKQSPTHSYKVPSVYYVLLTVTYDDNSQEFFYITVYVEGFQKYSSNVSYAFGLDKLNLDTLFDHNYKR